MSNHIPQPIYNSLNEKVITELRKKIYTAKPLDIKSSELNSWIKLKLLDKEDNQSGNWRRFDFTGFVWLRVIKTLRKFGLPPDKIYPVKELLFQKEHYSNESAKDLITLNQIMEEQGASKEAASLLMKLISNMKDDSFILNILISQYISSFWDAQLYIPLEGKPTLILNDYPNFDNEPPNNRLLIKSHISIHISEIINDFVIMHPKEAERIGLPNPLHIATVRAVKAMAFTSITIENKDEQPVVLEITLTNKEQQAIILSSIIYNEKYEIIRFTCQDGSSKYIVPKQFAFVTEKEKSNQNDTVLVNDLNPKNLKQMPVSLEEMELLTYMRENSFEKLEITFENGRIDSLEGLKRPDGDKSIMNILASYDYQEVVLVQHNGKTVSIKQKPKHKFGKKK